jgi:hypothetical protein
MIFFINLPKAKLLFRVWFFIFFAKCATACTLFEPQKPSTVSENAGQIVTMNWSGHDNDIYRLQIVANTPEGGVFWSLDTQIKEKIFTFKLPSNHAVLKVQISKNCDDTSLDNIQSLKPIGLLSEKKSCSVAAGDWLQDGQFIKFKPRNDILNYSLSLYEVIDVGTDRLKSNLLKKIEMKQPYTALQEDKVVIDIQQKFNLSLSEADQKYTVSVLPHCAAGIGLPLAMRLNKSK